jgi:hypothetical protein
MLISDCFWRDPYRQLSAAGIAIDRMPHIATIALPN